MHVLLNPPSLCKGEGWGGGREPSLELSENRHQVIPSRGNAMTSRCAHFLMCRPQHFAVTYKINPWMDPNGWARENRTLAAVAGQEWACLRGTLEELGARIELV